MRRCPTAPVAPRTPARTVIGNCYVDGYQNSSDTTFTATVGGFDRLARAALAVVFVGIGVVALIEGRALLGTGALLAGAGFGFNAVTGFCGVNAILGVNTCSPDSPVTNGGATGSRYGRHGSVRARDHLRGTRLSSARSSHGCRR
ncbi:hypothetical protein BRC61_00425 [Halobacteriales archaeon QH_10_65_19]|nr:MAG: hypothetical protein BRC61_00425 [Halobacteriales archaeon QH_10_65_19]